MIRQIDSKAPSFSTGLEGLENEIVSNSEKSVQDVAVADLSSVATQVLKASGELRKMEQNFAGQMQASQLHSKIGASPDDPKSYEVGPSYNDVRQGKGELAKGHAGAGVITLQQKLTRAGFPTKPDAYFGSKTETALKEFQRKNNLPDTGSLDKATLDALDKAAGPDPKPSPQPKPSPKPSPAPKPEPGPSPGPTPIIPNDLKLPDDPKLKTAALLDMASTKMENGYKKGQDPKFDAAVQTFLNADDLNPAKLGTDNPADAKLEASTSRFREAAHKAGF